LLGGRKVILDKDLAILYVVPTKQINQAVKRNISRFPEDFMFQLNESEAEILDPMDERAWQQKMLWCLKNSADCVQTGLAGRKRMQEYFGLPMMLEKLEKIYAL
jgi:hypothetical protein